MKNPNETQFDIQGIPVSALKQEDGSYTVKARLTKPIPMLSVLGVEPSPQMDTIGVARPSYPQKFALYPEDHKGCRDAIPEVKSLKLAVFWLVAYARQKEKEIKIE